MSIDIGYGMNNILGERPGAVWVRQEHVLDREEWLLVTKDSSSADRGIYPKNEAPGKEITGSGANIKCRRLYVAI